MKKAMRITLLCVLLLCISIVMHLLFGGIPLSGTPKAENIDRVIVVHSDYPDDVKEYTDEFYIELADALLGYLDYAPLKGVSDEIPIIQITYIMDDGTEIVVKANDTTVWWNGNTRAIQDEGMFVKMCTATFYLQQ